MCHTNYISTLFATVLPQGQHNKVQVSMKRSDGELFSANIAMLTNDEAEKVKKIFNYFEELRTCSCTKDSVCDVHSSLRRS